MSIRIDFPDSATEEICMEVTEILETWEEMLYTAGVVDAVDSLQRWTPSDYAASISHAAARGCGVCISADGSPNTVTEQIRDNEVARELLECLRRLLGSGMIDTQRQWRMSILLDD